MPTMWSWLTHTIAVPACAREGVVRQMRPGIPRKEVSSPLPARYYMVQSTALDALSGLIKECVLGGAKP
jgi:hypothetical protein